MDTRYLSSSKLLLLLRIAAIPLLLILIAKAEARDFPAQFLTASTLVFLLLAVTASLARGKWRDGMLILASLAFGLSVVEGAAFFLERRSSTAFSPGLFKVRPVIGWGPERAGRFHATRTDARTGATVYSVDYTIDPNLLRHTESCTSGPAIVFFGCSVTFGDGLNDAETLPQSFADSLGRNKRVLNLGFGGYGPHQFLSEMQAGIFDPVIGDRPDLFVFVTAAFHVTRTACKPFWVRHAPRYVIENGALVSKGACYEGLRLRLREWLETSAAYRNLIEPLQERVSRDDVELYIRVVLAAAGLAKQKYNVPVVILYVNSPTDVLESTGFTDEMIIERFRQGGATVVDGSLAKEEAAGAIVKIPGDTHPNGVANRLRAELLKDYLEKNMPAVLSSSSK
ncbi:MAG TPA: SGNH/GDSL hydrolase family protein [Methylocella sp.]|nr:SGNH/GDSL hydrolase family protein [Methylocella sp.]